MIRPNDPEAPARVKKLCPDAVYAYFAPVRGLKETTLLCAFRHPPEEAILDWEREMLKCKLAEAKEAVKAANQAVEVANQVVKAANQAAADATLTVEVLAQELAAADAEVTELRRHRTAPPPPAPE